MRLFLNGLLRWTVIGAMLAAIPAAAQTLTGSVAGVVKDQQSAVLPGVTVTLTGNTGARTAISDANGEYRFTALEPGNYVINAALQGFTAPKDQQLVVGVSENVTVLGALPVVDTKSSATETTISQDLLFSAPITRTAINVLNYAP